LCPDLCRRPIHVALVHRATEIQPLGCGANAPPLTDPSLSGLVHNQRYLFSDCIFNKSAVEPGHFGANVCGMTGHPRWGRSVRICGAALAILCSFPVTAEAAPCRNYPTAAARAIKPRVEALRLVEREAADRMMGLDTRPWPYLVGQSRAVANTIGEVRALQDEDGLDRCPDAVPHVRRVCATAALALAGALEEQAAGAATKLSKQIFAQAMAICESFMGLAPLRTALRIFE
jgi:hypothetical protein